MEKKEKLRFCFYCGVQLPAYKEGEANYCIYCGSKLNYRTKFQIEKSNDEILSS